jgi:macrolide phosphotransferase
VERPDKNLEQRARLAAQMRLVSELMSAVASGDRRLIDRTAAALRRLDDRLHAEAEEQDDYRRASSQRPAQTGPLLVPPRMGTDEDDDDVALMFAKTAPESEGAAVGDAESVAGAEDTEREPEGLQAAVEEAEVKESEAEESAAEAKAPEADTEMHQSPEPGPELEPGVDVRR